jgi:four helix bundle protein
MLKLAGLMSNADFVHKLKISLKELNETSVWLRMTYRAGLMREDRLVELMDENRQLCKILNASVKTAKKS